MRRVVMILVGLLTLQAESLGDLIFMYALEKTLFAHGYKYPRGTRKSSLKILIYYQAAPSFRLFLLSHFYVRITDQKTSK